MADSFRNISAGRLTRVDGLSDPRLAAYHSLRDRQLRRRDNFIAESEVVLRVLIRRGRHRIESVFLADTRVDKVADALLELAEEIPIYVASQAVLDQIVGFHIHRGVLAAAERKEVPPPEALLAALPGARRVVVVEGLTNHDNVGGVFRNAAAFGADAVLIDHATCDPLYRKAVRVSVGASLFVPYARAPTTADHLEVLRRRGFRCVALTPEPHARDLTSLEVGERVALLLGTEGAGLEGSTIAAADAAVRIDIEPDFDSLNVATACGVALYAVRSAQTHGR